MSHEQMQARCPGAKFVSAATLRGHALQFVGYAERWKGAVATVIAVPGARVSGGLFWLTPQQFAIMDEFEGVAEGRYERQVLAVTAEDGEVVGAVVYVQTKESGLLPGEPSEAYINTLAQGRIDCGIAVPQTASL